MKQQIQTSNNPIINQGVVKLFLALSIKNEKSFSKICSPFACHNYANKILHKFEELKLVTIIRSKPVRNALYSNHGRKLVINLTDKGLKVYTNLKNILDILK